ncbi:probable cysteine desulfurase [Patiria miniata]|uniref:Aminotransferase class V domain-containing protein n=1 Tax=Patiria miniata TaxID=46514 RepID=A0A914A0E5_PATMI|nr:probable cysteine desulfurase [Patiria miniata]
MAAPVWENAPVIPNENSCGSQVDFLPHGDRTFYTLPEKGREQLLYRKSGVKIEEFAEFRSYINNNIVGRDSTFYGPYGQRKVVYCDYTASGRSLQMIEEYISIQVLPLYGNTHTTTTVTSLQTTLYRHEARDIIRNAVNASEHDAVIFVGTGCTAAVHKLIHSLNLQAPPVVFVGPYEHHSNLLPWRETAAEVVRIPENGDGLVDMNCLEAELKKWHTSGRQLIGCFSAASNVTGILTDDIKVTVMLHRYGAMAFWDYATAGPYVDINMNPVTTFGDERSLAYKDAVFLSPHKFVGGVETPGILVAKKSLFKNPVPSNGGGGSVFFVSMTFISDVSK